MLSYKEDPNLPNQVVTLFNGEQEYRVLCTKIKGEYYVKDKDCFYIDKKWLRIDSGLILKDYETGEWFLKSELYNKVYCHGVVGFNEGVAQRGYFTPNPYNNVKIGLGVVALNSDILADNGYIEEISTGRWYDSKGLAAYVKASYGEIVNKIQHGNKGYNIEDNREELVLKTNNYNNYNASLSKDVRRYSRFLNDVSIGLEVECAYGYLPEHIQNRTGVVICNDGSLRDENNNPGPEFTTIPLNGAKGLQTIVNICNELKRRTLINNKCSLHVHLGNLPTNRIFLVSVYVLCLKIQDELFRMFPHYKSDFASAKKVLHKEKDYCQKLPKKNIGVLKASSKEDYERFVNDNYVKLFYWLSQNELGSGYNPSKEWSRKTKAHPTPQKWNRKNRYFWMNLMNTMFSTRNTVEFRLHTPTVNSQKVINWIFICNAIVRYAVLNSREILCSTKKINLSSVLNYYRDIFKTSQAEFLSDYLKAYVKERTDKFQEDFKKGDFVSKWEIEEDKNYEFRYQSTTHLF